MKPMVSVIVPVYNCADYLQSCLDSVIAQTMSSWEIICIDDGSTDGSLSMLIGYQKKLQEKMQLFTQKNEGPAKARNRALDAAQGKYIQFLDADDFLEPNCLEVTVARAEETDAQIVCFDIWFYNNRHHRLQHPPLGILDYAPFETETGFFSWRKNPDLFLLAFQTWAWNKLFRADYIEQGGFRFQEDVMRSEDICFVYPALVMATKITAVGERLINYRVMRADSAMATKDKHPLDFLTAILSFRDFLIDSGYYGSLRESYLRWAVSSSLYNLQTTSSYESFKVVFDTLKNSGFVEIGALDRDSSEACFSDVSLLGAMRAVVDLDIDEYLFKKMADLDFAREDALAVLDFTSMDLLEAKTNLAEVEANLADAKRDVAALQERKAIRIANKIGGLVGGRNK